MKKYGFIVLAAVAAALVSLFLSASAQAYPDARIDLSVSHRVVYSGDSFTATGTSTVECAQDLSWNNVVRRSAATRKFTTSYVAPEVDKVTRIPLTAICWVGGAGRAGASAPSTTAVHRTLSVTVLPRANAATAAIGKPAADIPGTGGPDRAFLLSGLVLVLAGATAVTVARRRAEEVELPGQTA